MTINDMDIYIGKNITKRERTIKAYILRQIRNIKDLPKLPKPNKEGKIGWKWLEMEDKIYTNTLDRFCFVWGYGNEKDWWDGKMSWVFWYVCDEIENLIDRLKKKEITND